MIRLLEIGAFLGLALALHVLFLAQRPQAGSEAGGVGGEAIVTLAAATPQLAAMVETWERPPDTAQAPDPLTPRQLIDPATPDTPQIDRPVVSSAPVQLQSAEDTLDTQPPRIDRAPPPPPPTAQPEPVPRPQSRPAPPADPGTASVTTAGRAAQKAAGTGGQQQAGQSASTQTSTASSGEAAKAQAVWGAKIRSRIERGKRFPRGASGSGKVVVVITVSTAGQMLGYRIRSSSGSQVFDTSAMQAVARATRLPAAPPELTKPQYSFALPIVFSR
ncbi:hypothetical protein So717_28340 [Roseobacter cerasinus]|uniref:TonB C-terminal domain-containing protein n=1 Tax=Roseobacter cerasinus TaxID=2602289 RepID=A0A640VVG4_9RHOB|nr:energy transducer TonB [Roseobacter cerasinus]GFE51081.1 hypothetical protein So717_28340 [Roseobacter cerasinus]